MTLDRLHELLAGFPGASVAVVGDFFLDKYLVLEESLTEVSVETGLDAYQVLDRRLSPGAAGTVTSNLKALDVGTVYAVGFTGEDGEGHDLRRGLQQTGVDMTHLLPSPGLFTPTYTKPMLRDAEGRERELNRLDIKNRAPMPVDLEEALLEALRVVVEHVQAVIISDQVAEAHLGAVSDRVRESLCHLGRVYPELFFLADSRASIGGFRNVMLKPNRLEAARACGYTGPEEVLTLEDARVHGEELSRRAGRPVYLTAGAEGILVVEDSGVTRVPGIAVPPPLDIVGAGDSATAGVISALCAGATFREAAVVGNCVASLTVQQLGVTGTASRHEVAARFTEAEDLFSRI